MYHPLPEAVVFPNQALDSLDDCPEFVLPLLLLYPRHLPAFNVSFNIPDGGVIPDGQQIGKNGKDRAQKEADGKGGDRSLVKVHGKGAVIRVQLIADRGVDAGGRLEAVLGQLPLFQYHLIPE